MKRMMLLAVVMLLVFTGCAPKGEEKEPFTREALAPVVAGYYAAQDTEAYQYFQNNSVQRFLAMWVAEATGDIDAPVWEFESFAAIRMLDHDMQPVTREGDQLYTCIFTDGGSRTGYAIIRYEAEGPALEKYGIHETTPGRYDLNANLEGLAAALAQTDIDIDTATAERVNWVDTEKNRSDQIVLFTDGKGGQYIYVYGDDDYTVEKLG